MKALIFISLVLISCCALAQKKEFIRVYDFTGKKINQGFVHGLTDSSLQLANGDAINNIAYSQIGFIKTKRPGGNNVLIGSVIVAPTLGIVAAVSTPSDTKSASNFQIVSKGEGIGIATLAGFPVGALIGALTIPFKNSKTYIINGDYDKWKIYQSVLMKKKNDTK